ncbi:RNA-binding family protein isoform 4 [Hibiscus syriacus]|uniref:RNA-binding family protein isoform 4 n=1 Tax=Hibiscus syriacus TaxID=106335 RepID=A0A6A3CKB5_HIBSY|nr:RNA-binding family protein isoform 4 [Hibiscus syriacus]
MEDTNDGRLENGGEALQLLAHASVKALLLHCLLVSFWRLWLIFIKGNLLGFCVSEDSLNTHYCLVQAKKGKTAGCCQNLEGFLAREGQPRGFGFVTYVEPSVVDKVIEDTHVINGNQVDIKRKIPKEGFGSKDFKTRKIFVGEIPSTVSEDEFKDYFTQYGEFREHKIMRDHASNRSRGFGSLLKQNKRLMIS